MSSWCLSLLLVPAIVFCSQTHAHAHSQHTSDKLEGPIPGRCIMQQSHCPDDILYPAQQGGGMDAPHCETTSIRLFVVLNLHVIENHEDLPALEDRMIRYEPVISLPAKSEMVF
ncbi:hypothetical protein B0O80DRAFT_173416 [Mortierella sp. GBAus27b]|nr:hypothetical protein B0O80DRAFT_173416 [Mortierella sp. GBAus27b]